MSVYVPIRLTSEEAEHLDIMVRDNNTTGFENRSEFIRLLLHREWNRRNNLPKPLAKDWQTVLRPKTKTGRNLV